MRKIPLSEFWKVIDLSPKKLFKNRLDYMKNSVAWFGLIRFISGMSVIVIFLSIFTVNELRLKNSFSFIVGLNLMVLFAVTLGKFFEYFKTCKFDDESGIVSNGKNSIKLSDIDCLDVCTNYFLSLSLKINTMEQIRFEFKEREHLDEILAKFKKHLSGDAKIRDIDANGIYRYVVDSTR